MGRWLKAAKNVRGQVVAPECAAVLHTVILDYNAGSYYNVLLPSTLGQDQARFML